MVGTSGAGACAGGPDVPSGSALGMAVRRPSVLPVSATVGEVRRFLDDDHMHLALLVTEDGRLGTCIDRADLAAAEGLDAAEAARGLGGTAGRTVRADAPGDEVTALMRERGLRRLAVVDDAAVLLGLICLKRSGAGYCTDEGVRERREERRRSTDRG